MAFEILDRARRFVEFRNAVKAVYGGRLDLTGGVFGRLTVLEYAGPNGKQSSMWRCVCECGEERVVRTSSLTSGGTKSCGCLKRDLFVKQQLPGWRNRTGAKNPNWNGGKQCSRGYISIYIPDHPKANSNGYVAEHRLVMEGVLGRSLRSEETVHHKNGVRNDNREENLELWSTFHPYGQRVEDKLKWAKEILATYGDCAGR